MVSHPMMSRLRRLSQMTAALRYHVRSAWAEDGALAAGVDADLTRMEGEIAAMADDAMAEALTPAPRTHCHCGAPMPKWSASGARRRGGEETCGSYHCRAIAREAKHAIRRHVALTAEAGPVRAAHGPRNSAGSDSAGLAP